MVSSRPGRAAERTFLKMRKFESSLASTVRPYPQNKTNNTSQATREEGGGSLWVEAAQVRPCLKAKQTTKKQNKTKNLNHGL